MIDILMNLKFKFMKVHLKQFELPVYVTLAEKLHLRGSFRYKIVLSYIIGLMSTVHNTWIVNIVLHEAF